LVIFLQILPQFLLKTSGSDYSLVASFRSRYKNLAIEKKQKKTT